VTCNANLSVFGVVIALGIGWSYIEADDAWRCPQHMSLALLRPKLLEICDRFEKTHGVRYPGMRDAIAALPDMTKLRALPAELAGPLEAFVARFTHEGA
jgi:hypothetical protein